jgi:hypothetical protein
MKEEQIAKTAGLYLPQNGLLRLESLDAISL